jgi:hypothetical protein
MSKALPLFVAAALGLLAEPALALRCQGKIITAGDPEAKVRRFCGEPTSVQQRMIYRGGTPRPRVYREVMAGDELSQISSTREELLIHDRSVVEVLVEEWTYNFGPYKLMRLVRFENGLVTEVHQLGYGYRD